jgi:uncharacterized protein YbjT (DUF2867 family)
MAILLTGGTGKTSSRIAQSCLDAKLPFLIASRKGQAGAPEGMQATKFDWLDSSTFENPFQHKFPSGEAITTVYLVAPETADPVSEMGPFIDLAKERGVRKFVYFTGSSADNGGPHAGQVWKKLADSGLKYTVLRATWFMGKAFRISCYEKPANDKNVDNFLLWQHGATIKNENKIYSACDNGKIPFISANDIARTAFHVLTHSQNYDTSYRLLGPELLTFDQVCPMPTINQHCKR